MTTEWVALISIVLVFVVIFLALRKFRQLNIEVSIFEWIRLNLVGKEPESDDARKLSATEIGELVARYSEDFCKAVASRDIRYLSTTTTPHGLAQARRQLETVLDSMPTHRWVSCRFVTYSIVGEPIYSNRQASVTVDETWEYQFANGQTSRICVRNVYRLALVGKEWRIEACEVLLPYGPGA